MKRRRSTGYGFNITRPWMSPREMMSTAPAAALPPISLFHPAWLVLIASVALWLLGVYCIDLSQGLHDEGFSPLARKQLTFGLVGLGAAAVAALPHYKALAKLAWPAAIVAVLLLTFLLLPFVPESIVAPRYGARRWINMGVADFQPSELAKIAFVLVIARYLQFRKNYRTFIGLIPPALIAAVPMGLILVEPDLDTALLFVPALVAMLVAAGAKWRHMLATGGAGTLLVGGIVAASLFFASHDQYPLLQKHQVSRIQALFEQFSGDERFLKERGYQGRQAMMLIGAGGATGHDPEKARALIHFAALPERHNDMILAVVANRFGLAGIVGVIGAYLAWIAGALWTAASCKDPFGRLVVVGFSMIIAFQAMVNIGMTIGVMPITGMTLPFVSYGGSSLLIGFTMVGVIWNVAMRRPPYLWRRSFEYDRADDQA